jgi:hypothetical protein
VDEEPRWGSALLPVPVDLAELADALEGDPLMCGGVLDLDSGEVWPQCVLDSMRDSEREELLEEGRPRRTPRRTGVVLLLHERAELERAAAWLAEDGYVAVAPGDEDGDRTGPTR